MLMAMLTLSSGRVSDDLPNITVSEMWPTPIFSAAVPRYTLGFKGELLAEAAGVRRGSASSVRRSNRGGWHSDTQLHMRADLPAIGRLADQVRAHAAAAVAKGVAGSPRRSAASLVLEIDSMWIMMLGPGDSTVAHKHPHAFLAGVFWLNVPEGLIGEGDGGALKLRVVVLPLH